MKYSRSDILAVLGGTLLFLLLLAIPLIYWRFYAS